MILSLVGFRVLLLALGTGREMQIVESSCSNDAGIIRISLELLLSPVVGIIINTHYYSQILREEALHTAR